MFQYDKISCLFFTLFLLGGISFKGFTQKLPKVQQTSMQPPANIKIDGKANEWNDQFQAYNVGNHIYYTVANDDSNFYLIAHMDSGIGNQKIFKGGLTFSILPSTKKANSLSVTFPAVTNKGSEETERLQDCSFVYKILKSDTVTNKTKIDSLISSSNNLISKVYNEVMVAGIPEISESLMSIYNTQGIRVAGLFDKKMKYTYELAIPLRYLGAAINKGEKFKYNIKLNTLGIVKIKGLQSFDPPLLNVTEKSNPDDLFLNYTTDFSGEYTLAKK